MPITVHQNAPGIAEVVIDHPPVNALDVAGWFGLAEAVLAAGRVPDNRVVILRAEGRGFCAGVDIKEIQAQGDEALIGANRGCFAAFAAVYECEVPVIAAVHGFCLGGGVGLAGNADIIVASDDATFGLPEVDRGALGAATHLSRLVPQHRMRSMVYTAEAGHAPPSSTTTARCSGWSPATSWWTPPTRWPATIAAKCPTIIRRAKESLNGIDPVDVQAQLPVRAGLHLRAARRRSGRRAARRLRREARRRHHQIGAGVADKRLTLDELVGELHSGMTIGIGGWGSRRKPMAAVRAILRSDLTDLTVVSYGGPDVGLLCAAGKVAKVVYGFVTLDSIPTDPHFRAARQAGAVEAMELDEGMFYLGPAGRLAAGALPPHPGRPGVRRAWRSIPPCAPSSRPTTTARSWWRCRPSGSTPP